MFKDYQIIKQAGGGHQVAAEAALRLPWAGLFEPWRPFVLIAAAAEPAREEKALQRTSAAKRCKRGTQRLLFDGKLRGVQLSLFPENDVQKINSKSASDSRFPALAGMLDPMAQEEALTEEQLAAEFEKLKTFR